MLQWRTVTQGPRKWVTPKEAAATCRVHFRTVYRWIHRRRPWVVYRRVGALYRVAVDGEGLPVERA